MIERYFDSEDNNILTEMLLDEHLKLRKTIQESIKRKELDN